jgi:hypothetical protein
MRFNRLLLLVPSLLVLFVAGCNNEEPGNGDGADTSVAIKPGEVRITKGEHGSDVGDVKLTVITPAANEVVKTDSVTVKVDLQGWDLAAPSNGEQSKGIAYSKDGQHIHVIIDDKPYMAMYSPEGFSVGALSEGMHTLRAFPSRSWHESVKAPNAFVAHTFYVKKKTGDPVLNDSLPLLTYSRPKGDYKGEDTKKILLDFYIAHAELGPDKYKVVASIDGQVKDTLTEWVPYYIEGLTAGAHKIKLELIGPDGAVVQNGPFNSVEREINVMPDQTAAAMGAHGGVH